MKKRRPIPRPDWFAVRCIFSHQRERRRITTYEERVTIWRAVTASQAILLAEREARTYARWCNRLGGEVCRYLGLAESYETSLRRLVAGDEVFSSMRDSRLDGARYLARFFATGRERVTRIRSGRRLREDAGGADTTR
jgi:hypothetical protein